MIGALDGRAARISFDEEATPSSTMVRAGSAAHWQTPTNVQRIRNSVSKWRLEGQLLLKGLEVLGSATWPSAGHLRSDLGAKRFEFRVSLGDVRRGQDRAERS
jgi:hypothetical protein